MVLPKEPRAVTVLLNNDLKYVLLALALLEEPIMIHEGKSLYSNEKKTEKGRTETCIDRYRYRFISYISVSLSIYLSISS